VNTLVKNNPDQFDRGFMIITNFKIAVGYTKDNKDLGQALLDAPYYFALRRDREEIV
jgi:hypothetical protein